MSILDSWINAPVRLCPRLIIDLQRHVPMKQCLWCDFVKVKQSGTTYSYLQRNFPFQQSCASLWRYWFLVAFRQETQSNWTKYSSVFFSPHWVKKVEKESKLDRRAREASEIETWTKNSIQKEALKKLDTVQGWEFIFSWKKGLRRLNQQFGKSFVSRWFYFPTRFCLA